MGQILYITFTIIVAILAAWIIFLQTDRKTKLLIVVVLIWALCTAGRDVYDFVSSQPKPILVLDQIEEHYDKKPPSAILFFIKLKNNGNITATNISTHPIIRINDETIYDKITGQADIGPGVTVRLRFRLKGETFEKVWNESSELKLDLTISYSDHRGKNYSESYTAKYKPYPDEPIIYPGWAIIKNE